MSKLALMGQAQGLLDEVVAHYEDAGVALPERRYVAPGEPGSTVWDCEQVTVTLASVGTNTSTAQTVAMPMVGTPAGVGLVRFATWAIQVVRCSPTFEGDGDPPDVTELLAAAAAGLDDAGHMSQLLVEVASLPMGSRSWLPIGSTINAGAVAPIGPEGGFQAVEATVAVSIMLTE